MVTKSKWASNKCKFSVKVSLPRQGNSSPVNTSVHSTTNENVDQDMANNKDQIIKSSGVLLNRSDKSFN